jgi:hypothetical protein
MDNIERGQQNKRDEERTGIVTCRDQAPKVTGLPLTQKLIHGQIITQTPQTLNPTPQQTQTTQLALHVQLPRLRLLQTLSLSLRNPPQVLVHQLSQPRLQQPFSHPLLDQGSHPLLDQGRGDLLQAAGQEKG